MAYDEFLFEIRRKVQERLGWYYYVGLEKISRGNGIAMDALCISKCKDEIRPTLYLNIYYDLYLESMTIDEILDEILEVYQWCENRH